LIDGVILLPDNLFYNTTAAGVIIILNKRKPSSRKSKIILLNASQRLKKGKPKNYIPEEAIRPLANAYLKGELIDGEMITVTTKQIEESDYNLSPGRWVSQSKTEQIEDIGLLIDNFQELVKKDNNITCRLLSTLSQIRSVIKGDI
jgi:type I restriction enzyme M protein